MSGVKDTIVHRSEIGSVRKAESLAGTQYHAVARGKKSRYFNTERGALNWLRKQAAK